MKKSKAILAIVLAIVLVLACLSVPTFSWFTRPNSHDGAKAVFGGESGAYSLYAYNGNGVAVATYSSEDGVTYSTEATQSFSGSEIPIHNRMYFRTTITNGDNAIQNVSLYARTLSIPIADNGSLAIGVNSPTRSYHDYSTRAKPATYAERDVMRIYFEKDDTVSGWNGTEFYICWNEDPDTNVESLNSSGSNGTYYKLAWVGDSNNGNSNRYYADIPKTATHAFFAVENWGTNNNGNPNYWQRSQTLWDLAKDGQSQTQSQIYKVTNTNSNGNATVVRTTVGGSGGACINHYYKEIFVATGNNTFNAALGNIPHRTGYTTNSTGSLKYYSSNTSVFTVDENTGEVTPVGAGDATLYTKSTGYYTDTQQVETVVHVTSDKNYVFNDVPIVKNIQMAAGEVVEVYWYVINNSLTNALSYTIDEVYLGL